MRSNLPIVGITMGDPVGIGPEIIPKALSDPRVCQCCRPVIYGHAGRLEAGMATTGTRFGIAEISSIDAAPVEYDGITVIDATENDIGKLAWRKPTTASGTAMVGYLNAAIRDAMAGRVSAIATGPINKLAMKMAGVQFSGHTEILAQRTGTRKYAMMLAGNRLKVVLATIHIPIGQVPRSLTTKGITDIVTLTDQTLKTCRRRASP